MEKQDTGWAEGGHLEHERGQVQGLRVQLGLPEEPLQADRLGRL